MSARPSDVRRVLACSVLLAAVGCAGAGGARQRPDSGVRGVVVVGPQCPVETGDPCPDVPWRGTVVASNGGDRVETPTDGSGRFEVHLEPGTWTLTPAIDGAGPPTARPRTVRVEPHAFATVGLTVDSGIR